MNTALSRRAMLSALTATAAVGALAAPALAALPTAERAEWDRTFAAYRDAVRRDEHFSAQVYHPAIDKVMAADSEFRRGPYPALDSPERAAWEAELRRIEETAVPGYQQISERGEELSAASYALETKLMKMPAPDEAALLWKLEKLLAVDEEDGATPAWVAHYVAQALADARRLLSVGRA